MNFLGGKERDAYNEPIVAEQRWWETGGIEEGIEGAGLRDAVEEIFIVGGMDEILLDSIKVMAGRLEVRLTLSFHVFRPCPCLFSIACLGEILGKRHLFIFLLRTLFCKFLSSKCCDAPSLNLRA